MNSNPHSVSSSGSEQFDDSLAAHHLLLLTQTEIQRVLNKKNLKYKDLAKRMNVTEARISQIFSENAGNLTIRTIAKIFHRLNEEAYITSASEISVPISGCTTDQKTPEAWELAGLGEYYVVLNTRPAENEKGIQEGVPLKSPSCTQKWAQADRVSNNRAA